MGWKHFPLLSKGFPYDFPCQIINSKLYSVCHDRPALLWRRLILKPNDIFTISCQSWLRTIPNRCKAEFNSCFCPSSSILNWKRGKLNTTFRGRALLSQWGGLVLQPLELWNSLVGSCCDVFHFPGSKKCKLVHCFINTVSVTVRGFF